MKYMPPPQQKYFKINAVNYKTNTHHPSQLPKHHTQKTWLTISVWEQSEVSFRPPSKLSLTLNLQNPCNLLEPDLDNQETGFRKEKKTRVRAFPTTGKVPNTQTEATSVKCFSLIWITFTNDRPQRQTVLSWLYCEIGCSRISSDASRCDIQFDFTCLETKQD